MASRTYGRLSGRRTKSSWGSLRGKRVSSFGPCHASVAITKQAPPFPGQGDLLHGPPELGPFLTADSFPPGTRHPEPLPVGEVGNLSHVGEGAAVADLELVAKAGRMATPAWVPGNSVLPSALAIHPAPLGRTSDELVLPLSRMDLRPPLWELLRPSVVIRRRPQRD